MATLWLILRVAALVYIGLCLYMYLNQRAYMFVPDRVIDLTPAAAGLAFETLTIATPDGERLQAWYVPAPAGSADQPLTVLYCHGNAGDIGDRIEPLRALHAMGLNALIFDYRGYGASTGRPTEPGTYADARAAWDYLVQARATPPDRIVIYGHSLGGAIAAWLATRVRPAGLLLESTFTSAVDLGQAMFPFLPIRLLARHRYDTLARLSAVRCPIFIAHAREDDTIPFSHGECLFAAAPEPKRFCPFPGDHNSGSFDVVPAYRAAVLDWLAALPRPST